MIIIQNLIKTKKGFAEKMAPRFIKGNDLETFEGFIKIEVLVKQNLPEHDELHVNMYWENNESFMVWKNSDSFKNAHKRPEANSEEAKKDSPILGSQLSTFDVVASKQGLAVK
ncbi:MAG: heme oxygenase [Bacillaceae bacterium]